MKKLYLAIAVALIMAPVVAFADTIVNFSPTTQIVTSTTTTAGINKASVRIKFIGINQPSTVAQTVTFYKNASTTTTATAVFTATIPGTVGAYYPIGTEALGDITAPNLPYFSVKTSTDVTPVNVTIIYK